MKGGGVELQGLERNLMDSAVAELSAKYLQRAHLFRA